MKTDIRILRAFSSNRPEVSEAGIGSALHNFGHKVGLVGRNIYHNHMARSHYNKMQKHLKKADAAQKHYDEHKNDAAKNPAVHKSNMISAKYTASNHYAAAQHHADQVSHHNDMAAKTDHEFAHADEIHNEDHNRRRDRARESASRVVKPAKMEMPKKKTVKKAAKPAETLKPKHVEKLAPLKKSAKKIDKKSVKKTVSEPSVKNAKGTPVKMDKNNKGWPDGTAKWAEPKKTAKAAPKSVKPTNKAVVAPKSAKPLNKTRG